MSTDHTNTPLVVVTNTTNPINGGGIDGADSHQKKLNKEQQPPQNLASSSSSSSSSSIPMPPPQSTKPTSLSSSVNMGGSLSTSSSNEELNWSSLNSKMKQVNKFDAKRGSILIEHLTEYNRLASSQVILGEELQNDNTSTGSNSANNSIKEDNKTVPIMVTPTTSTTTTTTTTTTSTNTNNNNTITSTTPTTPIKSTTPTPTSTPSKTGQIDSIVLSGINLFNEKPKKGIDFFIQHKLLEKSPESVAEFLHKCSLLNKKSIGDYLGDNDPFSIQTLEALIARFNFQDLDFDMAVRQLLYCFRLPGEAQKIDRIMQKFANQFYKDNLKSVFEDPDAVYMLAFAIILLNTDVHNPQIKNKMPKSKFAKSLHGINAGKDLPLEYIEDIYDRIICDEIKMEPTSALFPYACKKGWLNIRVKGRVTDKWSRKWCILSDGTLYFFRKPTDTTPVRYLHPDTVITTQKEMKGRKNCFILNHCSPPISIHSALMIKDHNNPQKYFNPQAIFQQLATFGKEKRREPKFWDSVTDKYDQKIDISLFNDSFDTDSIGSFDTLSESSNYYDEDVTSTSSSVNSTSPIHASAALNDQKKKIAFSLRLGNKKTKDQLNEYENEFDNLGTPNQGSNSTSPTSTSGNNSPNSSVVASSANGTPNGKPPVPARTHLNVTNNNNNINNNNNNNNNNSNSPNHSLTQPRPTIYKQGSSSLIRSSSISTFSTPTVNVTSASANNSNASSPSSTSSTSSNGSSASGSGISSSLSSSSSKNLSDSKKTIEDIIKQQEKLIKSSKQQTTVIINADTKREMDSWIRLILSQFKNNK